MNSRAFTIAITPTDVSTAQDVAEISVPSNKAIEIEEIEFRFTEDVITNLPRIGLVTGHTTSGSGGITVVDNPLVGTGSDTPNSTIEVLNTTIASVGTTYLRDVWFCGYYHPIVRYFPDKQRPIYYNSDGLIVFRFLDAPSATVEFGGKIKLIEHSYN